MNHMKSYQAILHKGFALFALLTIAIFWISTIVSEIFFSEAIVIITKQSIVYYGLAVMMISMAGTGITGFLITKGSTYPTILEKKKNMPFIAGNGLLLVICAVILYVKAMNHTFDLTFYCIQLVELLLGIFQVILIIKQMVRGKKLSSPP